MTATPLTDFGTALTEDDYRRLAERAIPRALATQNGIRRVDSITGREMFSRKKGDLSGLIIPNVPPWNPGYAREYRLRLDHPELEYGIDGSIKERSKYLQPSGRGNTLYFPVGIPAGALADTKITILLTEGEFKAISAMGAARNGADTMRFLPVAIAGVWNFYGVAGKTNNANGQRVDVKGVIPDFDQVQWKGRKVILAFDADAETNASVRAARWKLTSALLERGAVVGNLEWSIEEGKGLDDRLAKVGSERFLADIEAVRFGDWRLRLLRNDGGKLIACTDNAALMFENSPEWAGVVGYNEFTGGYTILKPPPAPITAQAGQEIEDNFDTEVVRWLERKGVMVKPDLVRRVVDVIARRNAFHPIQDYLDSLPPWDGQSRIATWLIDYCGAESSDESPNTYAMAVGEKFLVSCIARVKAWGCKVDCVLVLEGEQGIGKSTVPRILAGDEYFTDQLADMGSKDASMQVRGRWLIELSELDALSRVESARAKAFLSQQTERFRLPYGHRLVELKRQCVFIGTTNSDAWLKDESGNRRYWPVRCRHIDLDGLRRDRGQIWAEALLAYDAGRTWWPEAKDLISEATEEQRGRLVEDVWQEPVIRFAEQDAAEGWITVPQILLRLGIDIKDQDQAKANRVARCLKVGKWERYRKRLGKDAEGKDLFEWRYRKMEQK